MNAQTFETELRKIEDEARQKVVALVNKAQEDEGLDWNTDKPISFADSCIWYSPADGFAELAGWIYDRLAGRNRLHKKSMTKRIRKALGYTYP